MLKSGARLGPYEIVEPLGAGGMGEVYRARDARLGRDVAIKILPRELAATEEMRQRFEREARTISKLSHPGICAIHDVGREGDVEYLVMELIEGETLAARLAKGRMPIDQVLRSGAEIAAALAVAHARGIVHRDLKPANVMLTRSGVKLLDFGLARPFAPAEDSLAQTVTQGITVAGERALIGTVPYMSPEQIEGKPADVRADLFALGAVMHEMLTGTRAFTGSSQAAVMSAILHQDPPDIFTQRPDCPPALATLVRKCLARDPELRWSSAHDLALQLRDLEGGPRDLPAATRARGGPAWLAWAVAVIAVSIAAFAVLRPRAAVTDGAGAVRFSITPPPGRAVLNSVEGHSIAVSPDGSRIALVVGEPGAGAGEIAIRDLASTELRAIAGTEGAASIFWSPDGSSLAFFARNQLKRVALDGSGPVVICDVPPGGGKVGTWGRGGDILFCTIQGEAIYRVAANGGKPEVLMGLDVRSGIHRLGWPWYLPDGEHFLYISANGVTANGPGTGVIRLASHDGSSRALFETMSEVQFTAPDLLVFAREGVLYAQHFDVRAGRLRGGPFAIADSVRFFLSTGAAEFATSEGGTLVVQGAEDVSRPFWLDLQGRELGAAAAPGGYLDLALSRDGRTLLFSRAWPGIGTFDIWSLDLARGVETRLTTGRGSEFSPRWMPDGKSIVHSAQTQLLPQLFRLDLSSGAETPLRPSEAFQMPAGVTPDGRSLVYIERAERSGFSLKRMRLDDDSPSVTLLPTTTHTFSVSLSPDGRTLALVTDESGAPEAYVMPLSGAGGRVRVSNQGATQVRWSSDGRELLYLAPGAGLMAAPVVTTPAITVGRPARRVAPEIAGRWLDFEPAPDGRRLLAIVPLVNADLLPLQVIVHWPAASRGK